ncbi:MAG: hypothetical protein STHCBS139747_007157 [Sporothrix thermara]
MVVRIPASALCLAARAALPRASTVSAVLSPSSAATVACVSRRGLSSYPPRLQYSQQMQQQTQQIQQTPLPQYFPPQPPPPRKRRIQRSTYVFLAIGTCISTAATMFVLQEPVPYEELYPRGSEEERLFKEAEAGHADDYPVVKMLEAHPDWEEWDVGQRWREIEAAEDKEAAESQRTPTVPDVPGGELVDEADVSADVTGSRHSPASSSSSSASSSSSSSSSSSHAQVEPPTPQRTRLTTGALGGAEGMGTYHRIFHNTVTGEIVSVLRIGRALAGWPGTAHGGALATILDEALGRCAILAFPARTGVTARLELSYRKPVRTGQFYVVRCTPQFPPADGNDAGNGNGNETSNKTPSSPPPELRKLWCHATLESMEGSVHVVARGLFVVPRKYKLGRVEDKF